MTRLILITILFLACSVNAQTVLVEAESFNHLGGWVVDPQFMDQMGSPYLLAHGLGEPVDDATTMVEFPALGEYRLWVRTRDWVAPWKASGAPGRFQLFVDTRIIEKEFGAEGDPWHWQDGGTVEITKKRVTLGLHDLTGFEGRCDALLFTTDPDFVPPDKLKPLQALRHKLSGASANPVDVGTYDLVVVGGGMAGTCAAVSAARLGLQVALIQDRPVLGGNNSSEVRVHLGGEINKPPYPAIGAIVKELDSGFQGNAQPASHYDDDKKLRLVQNEENISLFLNYRVNQVKTEAHQIMAVIAQNINTAHRIRLTGKWFADCTGDGVIGYLAGADYEITDKGHMGRSNLWRIVDTGKASPFPRCPWAHDLTDKPIPEGLGRWFWESGFDHDPFEKSEYIRDNNFRGMYGAWDALKNVQGKFPHHKLAWAAFITGKRESRRLLGDVILTKEDLLESRAYPDGSVPTSWTIDLHLPDPKYASGFEGNEFISEAQFTKYPRPYWIPYRCFYSRNIKNLFMAGRDISVTHEALGTVRVMRTTGMMGEIVGMAASLCKKHDTSPRGVYQSHLDELKEIMK